MNIKKINELPVLQQATEETSILVEQNGTAGRIPADVFSGDRVIGKLAPAFTKTGAVVTCNPLEGYPLEVVSRIAAAQPNHNLYPDDIEWGWDEGEVFGECCIPNFPAGTYTAYVSADWLGVRGEGMSYMLDVQGGETVTFTITQPGDLYLYLNAPEFAEEYTIKLEKVVPAEFENVVLTVNDSTYTTEFLQAVSNGIFNWTTGVLAVLVGSGDNLIPVNLEDSSNWSYDEDSGFYSYEMDLPEGRYTIHVNEALCLDFTWMENVDGYIEPMTEWLCDTSFDFHHMGGKISFVETNGITDHVEIVEAEYFEYHQLTPHEIVGKPGTNTLQSSTGDTEVSYKANPAATIAEQEARIAALEAALLNG